MEPPDRSRFSNTDFASTINDSTAPNVRPMQFQKPPNQVEVKDFNNAKSYFNARANNMLDPKWHTPVMINNYEDVEELPHPGGAT